MASGPELAGLCSKLGLSGVPPRPVQVETICRLLCSSCRWLILASTSLEAPWSASDHTKAPRPREGLLSFTEVSAVPWSWPLHSSYSTVVSASPLHSPQASGGKSLTLMCQQQLRLNYKRRVHRAHTGGGHGGPSLSDLESCATGPFRTPTNTATLPRL